MLRGQKLPATMKLSYPHPIAALPPEIMSEVFLSACPPWHLNKKDEPVNSGLTPLFLGSICRSWRDIAWSTPTLWCSFIVHINLIPNQMQKELLAQWITRAKGLLLSVALRANLEEEDEAGIEFLNTVLEVLVAHSTQWRVINLDISPTPSMERVLSRVEHRIPNLISLALKPSFMTFYGFNHLNMHMFQDAPLLKELTIISFFLADFNLDSSWTRLKTLHIMLESTECLEALRLCSENLIHCSMECIDDPEIFELTPVVAVHLTTLEVTNTRGDDGFYSILPFMTLPALRQLSLHLDSVDSIDHIGAMLSRSSFPALEVLALTSLNRFIHVNGERKLLDLLAAIPSLIKVRLTGKGRSFTQFLTDAFIDMLHPLHRMRDNSFPAVILPNLRVFEYEGPLSLNVTSLADMLSYRWRHPQALLDDEHGHMAQLTSVTIKAPHGFHLSEDNTRAFENLAGEGMDLNLNL